jgi:hypothetical protein
MTETVPDIVRDELVVDRSLLLGWAPIVVDGDSADRERILDGLVTPSEIALQIAFGHQVHGTDRFGGGVSFDEVFVLQRDRIRGGIQGINHHEPAYLASIALWSERDIVIDYKNSYADFSTHLGAQKRTLGMSKPDELLKELHNSLGDYIKALKFGAKSRKDFKSWVVKTKADEFEAEGFFEEAKLIRDNFLI